MIDLLLKFRDMPHPLLKNLYGDLSMWTTWVMGSLSCLWLILGSIYLLVLYIDERNPFLRVPLFIGKIFGEIDAEDRIMGAGWVYSLFGIGAVATYVAFLMWFLYPAALTILVGVGLVQGGRKLRRWTKDIRIRPILQKLRGLLPKRRIRKRRNEAEVDAKFQEMFPVR